MHHDRNILTNASRCICYLFILTLLLNTLLFLLRETRSAEQPAKVSPAMQVVLIPLDSRPPCRDFPGQLTRIANINVIIPPPGYLDYYQQPADCPALADWLTAVGPSADAVIVSIDQLVHGGLLASRLPAGNRASAEKVLLLLEQFHQQNPHIPIYAFNIIPRLLLADTDENKPYRYAMATYSALTDKLSLTGSDTDRAQLEQLETIIPLSIRQRYLDMYATNLWLSQQLMDLATKGVLHHVVLGQDDAQPYGMANMTKRTLQLMQNELPTPGHVSLTRGTDEIAATLVARLIAEHQGFAPHIYVNYSWPGAAQVVMPYMPGTVEQTVAEKIALVNGLQVSNPAEADFILYVHIGTPATPPSVMLHAVKELKQHVAAGRPVSLVDLSEKYDTRKNLFPYLAKANFALSSLLSYNGWNTTSNSVGTAVAHPVIYIYARNNGLLMKENHYAYLNQRFLDDWYYQKLVQPQLDALLTLQGITPGNLGTDYPTANHVVQRKMAYYADSFYTHYFKLPFRDHSRLNNFQQQTQLPWPRTFELQVDVAYSLYRKLPAFTSFLKNF